MKSMVVNLAVKDIKQTIKYYEENFGFVLQMAVDEEKKGVGSELKEGKNYIWAMIAQGGVSFMLQSVASMHEDVGKFFDEIGASLSIYIEVENVDHQYEKIQNRVEIYKDIQTTWYGQREFYVKDINGYILGFASKSDEN